MIMQDQALAFLNRDPLAYADMLVPIERGSGQLIAADLGGVLLLEGESGAHMLAAATDADALRLLEAVGEAALMSIHNKAAAHEAEGRFGLSLNLTCHQAVWTGAAPPRTLALPLDVRLLDMGYGDRINGLYSHAIGLDYIMARLARGALWGAFEGDVLAGFIGVHAEGSMGMLEVLPPYRRRGVGRLLSAFLIGEQLKQGVTPFSQFTVDNGASRALNTSLGMAISEETLYWLE